GAISGIAVGIGAAVVLLAIASFVYIKRRAKSRRPSPMARADLFTGSCHVILGLTDFLNLADPAVIEPQSGHRQIVSAFSTIDTIYIHAQAPVFIDSLTIRASPVNSGTRDLEDQLPHSRQENVSGGVMTEKRLLESTQSRGRNRAITTSGGRGVDEHPLAETHAAATVEDTVSSGRGIGRHRDPRHEMDGGVRLAGGRLGEVAVDDLDQDGMSESSTLPPPYSSHFGEMWYVCFQWSCLVIS
ncbi:hypothetical protein V8D89_000451, partial [Ganoderma adspersum]